MTFWDFADKHAAAFWMFALAMLIIVLRAMSGFRVHYTSIEAGDHRTVLRADFQHEGKQDGE